MKNSLVLVWCVGMLMMGAGCASVRVEPVKDPTNKAGLYYALPRTVILLDIPVTVTKVTKGKGAALLGTPDEGALSLIGLSPKTLNKQDGAKAVVKPENVKISTRAVPDKEHIYYVAMTSGRWLEELNMNFTLQESGVISEGLAESKNLTIDVAARLLETALQVVVSGGKVLENMSVPPPDDPGPALKLIKEIQDIRRERQNLIAKVSKKLDANPETVKLLLDDLTTRENKALKSLIGESKEETSMIHVEYIPEPSTGQEQELIKPLFDIMGKENLDKGTFTLVVCPRNKDEVFVPEALSDQSICAEGPANLIHTYSLALARRSQTFRGMVSAPDDSTAGASSKNSFYYRIPEESVLSLIKTDKGQETRLLQTRPMVAQFGTVACLPAKPGGVYMKYDLKFHDQTGAIKSAGLISKPVNLETLDMARKAFASYEDAEAQKRKAAAAAKQAEEEKASAAADEVNLLKREEQILQLKKSIRDLENDLGQNPGSP